jgi:hypothetical protein
MPTTSHKAWIAALGTTLTSITTALATVQLVLDDDAIDLAEYSTLATAGITLVATIYAVWRTPNRPVETPENLDIPREWHYER